MEEYKLNNQQKLFASEYITNGGNATQAAITAGYSEKTAYSQGNRLLKHDEVKRFLKETMEAVWDEKKMTISEALAISASIARGEPQNSYFKQTDKQTGKVVKEFEHIITPQVEERQRSLEHIFKVAGAFLDKKEIDAKVTSITIDVGDWDEEDAD